MARVDKYLEGLAELRGSDLHLNPGSAPRARVAGKLVSLPEAEEIGKQECAELLEEIMSRRQLKKFERDRDVNVAYSPRDGSGRFRVSVFEDRRGMAAVFRLIPTRIPTLMSLRLNPVVERIPEFSGGLVFITGPSGSGKTTTLAAVINAINKDKYRHIVTIEDPVEFLHRDKRCHVTQRELGNHARSYKAALESAMTQDADVIMVDEVKDVETAGLLLSAADTGVLVLTTLQTNTAAKTVERFIDFFSPADQAQARLMLSSTLRAVICQQLIPIKDAKERIPANEIMFLEGPLRNMVRDGNTSQIASAIFSAAGEGMTTMDKSILNYYRSGMIAADAAVSYAIEKESMKKNLETQEAGEAAV